jgi:CHAD domain-containing protein
MSHKITDCIRWCRQESHAAGEELHHLREEYNRLKVELEIFKDVLVNVKE